jgi:hypothetical protein
MSNASRTAGQSAPEVEEGQRKRKLSLNIGSAPSPPPPFAPSEGLLPSPSYKKRRQSETSNVSSAKENLGNNASLRTLHRSPVSKPILESESIQDSAGSDSTKTSNIEPSKPVRDSARFDSTIDPFQVDPPLVSHLMEMFITHINSQIYCMFPSAPFLQWVFSERKKSQNDMMLLYCVLTIACLFSDREDRASFEPQFRSAANSLIESRFGKFTLQLVQSRILFALYQFACENPNDAWEHCGSAIRAAMALSLNYEQRPDEMTKEESGLYTMNNATSIECRRRTFWAAYLIDKFNGYCSGRVCLINDQDIFLRLPCTTLSYEQQRPSESPMFSLVVDKSDNRAESLSPMAYLVEVSCLWGMTTANLTRMARSDNDHYDSHYEVNIDRISAMLRDWADRLPPDFAFSEENLAQHGKNNTWGAFITAHSIYYTSMIKLHRYGRLQRIKTAVLVRNLRTCLKNARADLALMKLLFDWKAEGDQNRHATSIPFIGYSILTSADVISARFVQQDQIVVDQLEVGLGILGELRPYWRINNMQRKWVAKRTAAIRKLLERSPLAAENDTTPSPKGLGETDSAEGGLGKHFSLHPQTLLRRTSDSPLETVIRSEFGGVQTLIQFSKPLSPPIAPFDDLIYSAPDEITMQALYP